MQTPWLVLDPNVHGGVFLAGDLNGVMGAILSNHLGSTRPSYAVNGMIYPRETAPNTVKLYYFDGGADIEIGTINTSANTFTPAGVSSGVPTATLFPFAGSTVPSGFLLCNGQAVSRITFAALFTAIGTTYGSGDGSSTFNLPDIRGRVVAGRDQMGAGAAAGRLTSATMTSADGIGGNGGVEQVTLSLSQMPAHQHNFTVRAATGPASTAAQGNGGASATGATTSRGGSAPHPNVQPTIVMNYIIKT